MYLTEYSFNFNVNNEERFCTVNIIIFTIFRILYDLNLPSVSVGKKNIWVGKKHEILECVFLKVLQQECTNTDILQF